MMTGKDELKKLIKDKRLIIGTDATIKNLKKGKLEKIWFSSNIPDTVKQDIISYSKLNPVEIVDLAVPNDELGVICKKQFSVSVASLAKGEK